MQTIYYKESLPMMSYIFSIFIASILSYSLSYFFLKNADKLRQKRNTYAERVKLHKKYVPRLGGLALYLAFCVTFPAVIVLNRYSISFDVNKIIGLFIASLLVVGTGVYDDLVKRLSYKVKFAFQVLAALVLVLAGYNIQTISIPFLPNLSVGVLGPVFVVLWMLVIMNAVNLIDGLDGLASGVCLIAGAGFFIISAVKADIFVLTALAVFLGVILGFLRFNIYPAKLFLGDSGSLFLGFMMGIIALEISVKRATVISMAIPMLTLFIPVASVFFTFTRRIATARNPFKPDSMHLHYRLIRAGISHKNTVYIFYMVTFIYMLFGLWCYFSPVMYELAIIIVAGMVMLAFYVWALRFINLKKSYKREQHGRYKEL